MPPSAPGAAEARGPHGARWGVGVILLAVAYFGAARLGLSLAFQVEQVSPVWPPSGLALSALLLLGIRYWPGVTLGAFMANALASEPLPVAAGIAAGNTLEALLAVWLLQRRGNFDTSLSRSRDVVKLVALAALLSTTASATIGVTSLCLGQVQEWSSWTSLWSIWWLGDATGDLVVAPFLLVIGSGRIAWRTIHFGEAGLLLAAASGACVAVFFGYLTANVGEFGRAYVVFPFIIWAALRFGQPGAATISLLASVIAVCGTVHGTGPFGAGPRHDRLLMLQAFLAVVAVTALTLGAALSERRAAETLAKRQREWLRVTLTSIDDAVIATDERGMITFLNPLAQRLTGWNQDALGQHVGSVVRLVEEETGEPIRRPLTPVLRGGKPDHQARPARLIARDGKATPVEDSAAPIRDAEGNIIGVVLVFRDTGARRRDEQRLAVLHAVTRILVESATLLEAGPRILQTICDNLSWQVGALWQVSADDTNGPTLHCVAFWQSSPARHAAFEALTRQLEFPPGIGLPGRIWASGQPAWIADVVQDANFPRAPVAAQDGLHGAFGLPIRLGADVLGVIEFFSSEIREPDEALLHVLATVGSQIGQFVERQQAEQAVRESEERFRTTITHAAVGVAIMDLQGKYLHANPAFCNLTGYTEGELRERDYSSITPAEDLPGKRYLIQQLLEGNIPSFVVEKRYLRKGGGEVWVQNSASLIRDHRGRSKLIVVFVEDVTERKRAVEALRTGEEQLRLALDAGQMGAWDWNVRTGAVTWSPALEAIHGLPPGAFDGTLEAYLRDVHPQDRANVKRSLADTLERKTPHLMEYRIVWPDGSVHWVQGRGRLFCDAAGAPARMTGVCLDVTGQKRAEQDARLLADASAALVALGDFKSTLQLISQLAVAGFADWCAVDLVDATGEPHPIVMAHSRSELAKVEMLQRRLMDEAEEQLGARSVVLSGKPKLIPTIADELLVAAATDADQLAALRSLTLQSYLCVPLTARGKTLGALTFVSTAEGRRYGDRDLAVAEDLAYRTSVALLNVQLYAELRETDRRKDEFLALLAHELRNPLAPIRNGVEAMRVIGLADPQLRELRDMLQRQVDHMSRLVDDLLDVSRVTRGKVHLKKELTSLDAVVAHAVETCRPLLDQRRHQLSVSLPAEPLHLEGDLLRLAQVFTNLLNNAAKYSKERSRITLNATREASHAVVRVVDEGIGIAPEMLPRIFDLFTQADASLGRSDGGMGIGLTLVRSLVELHGGSVQATSQGLDKGSEFEVRLPLTRATAPRTDETPAKQFRDPKATLRRNILVVDDNKDAAKSLAVLLRMMGHTVRLAHDGIAALEAAQADRPEVVLLDIGLPGTTGLEVARRMRGELGLRDALLVAVTGYGQEEDRRNSIDAGFDAHFVKPVDLSALRAFLSNPDCGPPP